MRTYVTALLAAGALALAMGISEPAHAKHGGWHGGGWHGHGWHGHGWRGWGPGWGWGWGPGWGWRGWGWGPGVGIYIGPGYYGRRCWSRRYGWVPCRWAYRY
jgi:hypothetical protein